MSEAATPLLWRQFMVQCRVIRSLMIREITAHFGRRGIGALWLAVGPLTFTVPVMVLWYIVRPPFEHNIPIIEMLWSGYMPVLLFRHLGSRSLGLISRSVPLMYHRNIREFDVFIATCAVEVAQNIFAATIMYLFFYFPGIMDLPANPPLVIIGYLYMIWWCVSCALIVVTFSERSSFFVKMWQPISYTYMFYSGFGFLSDWLPEKFRGIALMQPSLQAFDMIRAGLLGSKIVTHYNIAYDTFALLVLTLIGLVALRDARKHHSYQ